MQVNIDCHCLSCLIIDSFPDPVTAITASATIFTATITTTTTTTNATRIYQRIQPPPKTWQSTASLILLIVMIF